MDTEKNVTSRRDFVAKAAAAVVAVPALSGLGACTPAAQPAAPAPAPTFTPPPAPAAPPRAVPPDPVGDALMEIIQAREGSRLTPEQTKEVRESVVGNMRAAKQLHDFRIPMHVEPSWTVSAYRREGA